MSTYTGADATILGFGAWGYDTRGWAMSTRRQYQAVLNRAARQVGGIEALRAADAALVRTWISSLPRNADTRNHALAVLVAFYQWLIDDGERDDNPADGVRRLKRQRAQPRALDTSEAEGLLRALADVADLRVHALVGLMIWAGLRVNEALHVRWTDISPEGWLHVPRESAKGGHERAVPLHDDLRAILDGWERECPSHEWVISSEARPDMPASYSWGYKRVIALGEAAGVVVHPHKLRGTFATGLLETGTDIRVIAEALGHANVQTTMRYTRTRPALVAAAVSRLTYSTVDSGGPRT